MLTFLTAALTLAAVTVLVTRRATRWPEPSRDLGGAAVGVFVSATWVLSTHAVHGPALWAVTPSHVLYVVDLAVVPLLMLTGLLVGRTILLRRMAANAADHQA